MSDDQDVDSTKSLLDSPTSSRSGCSTPSVDGSGNDEDFTNLQRNKKMIYEQQSTSSKPTKEIPTCNSKQDNKSSSESHTICIEFENIPKKYTIGIAAAFMIFMVTIMTVLLVVVMYIPQIAQQPCSIPNTIQTQKIKTPQYKQDSVPAKVQPISDLVTSPSDVVVEPETNAVKLQCLFDTEVSCYWTRGGQMIENDDRYRYVTNRPTTDCSITIDAVKEIDFAAWQCGCYGNDEYVGITSQEAFISKPTQELLLIKSPKDQTKYLDEDVILECEFSAPVTCEWLRNGNHVTISDRYSFVVGGEAEKSDCSIKINGLKTIDFTSWSCGSVSDDNAKNTFSKKIFINQQIKPSKPIVVEDGRGDQRQISSIDEQSPSSAVFRKTPESVTAKSGSTIELECEFTTGVTCAWLRNGQHVDIQGRYSYTNERDRKDCSIEIRNLQANDKGGWVCSSMADSYGNGSKSNEATVSIK